MEPNEAINIGQKPQVVGLAMENDFPVVTETIELPSKGILYGGKNTVKMKLMTAASDDILFDQNLIENNNVLSAVLEASIMDKDIFPENLLVGDRNYLLIQLRKLSFGVEYEPGTQMVCQECQTKYYPKVNLEKIKPRFMPEDVTPDSNGEFSLEMNVTHTKIKFRLLKGSDEKILAKKVEAGQKMKSGIKTSKLITERYLLQIMEVSGNRDKIYIKKYIDSMPIRESAFFRLYSDNISPGVDLSDYPFECPSCGHVELKDVPMTPRLFYPDLDLPTV